MLFYHFVCDKCKIGITFKPTGEMNPYRQVELVAKWVVKPNGKTYCPDHPSSEMREGPEEGPWEYVGHAIKSS